MARGKVKVILVYGETEVGSTKITADINNIKPVGYHCISSNGKPVAL